jgi:outer membrane receptor protein involved in Fe transport
MNIKTRDLAHRSRQIEQLTFRRTAMAIALAGITAFSAGSAYAAEDKTLAELQKALEVLKTENANLKKQLDNRPAQKADTAASESSTAGATEATSDTKSAASENTSILDAVVVKFKKKSVLETVKDQPKSISIVSGDELAEQGALNVKDIFKNIGNIKWDFGNAKTNAITIRGVSTTGGSTEQIIPDLGVTVDGVPYGYVPFITGSDFVDLQSVSIARGPQGSTGGLNSTMGTLNITSKQP